MSASGARNVILAALAANMAIAVAKFIAAFFTRSSALLAEGFHSVADTANQIFLLIGVRLSARPPDEKHHFGHAHERYFWAFIVAISIFTIGAAFSIYEGVQKIIHHQDPGHALRQPLWGMGVLGVSIVLEALSWLMAMREFLHTKGRRSILSTISDARDPVVLTVVLEDSAALFGLIVALLGLILAWATGSMIYDGVASIVVGAVLTAVAYFLARETRDLLLGESIVPERADRVREIVLRCPKVQALVTQRSMHLGPDEVLLVLKVDFIEELSTTELEASIDEVEVALRRELPFLKRIWIEPGSRRGPSFPDPGQSALQ